MFDLEKQNKTKEVKDYKHIPDSLSGLKSSDSVLQNNIFLSHTHLL